MTLRLADKWVWDFWLAQENGCHHAFYLQAPRSLGETTLRHRHASIGHAVSADLKEWQVLPDALQVGSPGSWDDLATWTGSVIDRDGRWHMLYTGINRSENGLIQRIGLAVSDDLVHWSKHPANPLLEADGRWYELLDLRRWRDQSWRDPWLFVHPGDGMFHVLVTARSPHGDPRGAGVIGHARSSDLVEWEVLPPLTAPGEFAQVEAPQLVVIGARHRILFSCLAEDHSPARRRRLGQRGETGTFVLSAQSLEGPYCASDSPLADPSGQLGPLYAGRLIELEPGRWHFIAFRGAGDLDFVGELTDPLPIMVDGDGEIRVVAEASLSKGG